MCDVNISCSTYSTIARNATKGSKHELLKSKWSSSLGFLTFLEAAPYFLQGHVCNTACTTTWSSHRIWITRSLSLRILAKPLHPKSGSSSRINGSGGRTQWYDSSECMPVEIKNKKTNWIELPLKRLLTAVLKYTKRRRSDQRSVRGTEIGCKLLVWSANTCQSQADLLFDGILLALKYYNTIQYHELFQGL